MEKISMTLTGDDTQIVTHSIKKKGIYIGFGFNLEKNKSL